MAEVFCEEAPLFENFLNGNIEFMKQPAAEKYKVWGLYETKQVEKPPCSPLKKNYMTVFEQDIFVGILETFPKHPNIWRFFGPRRSHRGTSHTHSPNPHEAEEIKKN